MERRKFLGVAVATATLAQAKDVLAGPAEEVAAPEREQPAYLSSVFQENDRAGGFFELVDDPVAAGAGASPAVPSLGGKTMRRIEADGYVRASHFGAVQGDNANLALQQALDYAGDYRSHLGETADFRSIEVRLEPDWTYRINQSLMLPAGVILVGGRFAPGAVISAGDGMESAYLIDTEENRSTDKRYLGVVGVYLDGGPKNLGGYLRLRGTNRARVLQVIGRGGCAGSGFLVDPTNSNGQFENLYFVEAVNREVSESEGYVGAVDISGGDHYLSNIYGQVGEVATGRKFGNGRKCGIRIAGHVINAGGRIRGELSEVGVVLDSATYCAFSQIVADLNFGHGIVITGDTHDCAISIASTIGNGRDTTDKFFGVYFKGDGAHDNVVGTLGVSRAAGHTNSMRFGAHADSKDKGNVVGQFYGGNWTLKTQD